MVRRDRSAARRDWAAVPEARAAWRSAAESLADGMI